MISPCANPLPPDDTVTVLTDPAILPTASEAPEPAMFANGINSNSVRGIIMGGYETSAYVDTIEYISIPTLGNSKDFGNLSSARGYGSGASSPT